MLGRNLNYILLFQMLKKSPPDGPVERRSVPGGYFSELYIQVKGMLEDRVLLEDIFIRIS